MDKDKIEDRFAKFYDAYYKVKTEELFKNYPGERSLTADLEALASFEPYLASELTQNPDDIIPIATASLSKLSKGLKIIEPIHARFIGKNSNIPIQDIGTQLQDKLLTIDSIVARKFEMIPIPIYIKAKCAFCGTDAELKREDTGEQPACPRCKRKSLKIDVKASKFINRQRLSIKSPVQDKSDPYTYHLDVWLEDDLVDKVKSKDRVEFTGIIRIEYNPKEERYGFALHVIGLKNLQPEIDRKAALEHNMAKVFELVRASQYQFLEGVPEERIVAESERFGTAKAATLECIEDHKKNGSLVSPEPGLLATPEYAEIIRRNKELEKDTNSIKNIITKLTETDSGAKITDVLDQAEKQGISRDKTTRVINTLERMGDIYSPKPGILKIVRREEEPTA